MRFSSRSLLIVLAAVISIPAFADHFESNCQLSYVGSAPSSAVFQNSPHGVFRNTNVIYALRGQRLITQVITDLGNVQVFRDDLLPTLAARDKDGAAAYRNGFLYVSGEGGLEVFDLRQTRPGPGSAAPVLLGRTADRHYRRMVIQGNVMAAVFPIDEYPCFPGDGSPATCPNYIDVYSIADPANPVLMSRITSAAIFTGFIGFNDVAFTNGYLWATGHGGTFAWDITNPALPQLVRTLQDQGRFLTTNGTNLLGVGRDTDIGVYFVGPGTLTSFWHTFTLPSIVGSSNQHRFHYDAYMADTRLVMLVDEVNPMTNKPARTVAFDVFDFSVPLYEGSDDRIYENVSFTYPDEVKHDPIMVGAYVHVIGESSGLQTWGACGVATGEIEFDNLPGLSCNGAELHGWVTGPNRINRLELFLDDTPLGVATFTNNRTDIMSNTPVLGWKIAVNLDLIERGNRTLRLIATDIYGTRKQIYSEIVFFNGPGLNCTTRRRAAKR